MSVIVVSKKAYNAFKKYSIIFGVVAALSVGANVAMSVKMSAVAAEHQATTERLIEISEQLQVKTEENKKLSDKIEKRKIAALAMSSEVECLARNIYYEAGGESTMGKHAVAHVTMNRVKSGKFPSKVCDVVYQGVYDNTPGCQFSWACGKAKAIAVGSKTWEESKRIATLMLSGAAETAHDVTKGALYFHAVYVRPGWAKQPTARIDNHVFYR